MNTFPHTFTTLDDTDMRKVRPHRELLVNLRDLPDPNKPALDVRILKVAEWIMGEAEKYGFREAPIYKNAVQMANDLREIAAELRDAATKPEPPRATTVTAILDLFAGARSDVDLMQSWADVASSLPALYVLERLRVLEAYNTRMSAVCRDDG